MTSGSDYCYCCCCCYCLLLLPQVTTGSDVYSFGVLMWQCYTGHEPFVLKAGLPVPNPAFPYFPPSAHPEYRDLADSCLRRDPHLRPSFSEISSRLADFFSQERQQQQLATAPLKPAPAYLTTVDGPEAVADGCSNPAAAGGVPVVVAVAGGSNSLAAGGGPDVRQLASVPPGDMRRGVDGTSSIDHQESRNVLANCLLNSYPPYLQQAPQLQ